HFLKLPLQVSSNCAGTIVAIPLKILLEADKCISSPVSNVNGCIFQKSLSNSFSKNQLLQPKSTFISLVQKLKGWLLASPILSQEKLFICSTPKLHFGTIRPALVIIAFFCSHRDR